MLTADTELCDMMCGGILNEEQCFAYRDCLEYIRDILTTVSHTMLRVQAGIKQLDESALTTCTSVDALEAKDAIKCEFVTLDTYINAMRESVFDTLNNDSVDES